MTLDLSTLKPNTICISRDGREWEYIGKMAEGYTAPHVFHRADEGLHQFYPGGKYLPPDSDSHSYDIVSIKPEERVLEGWANIYKSGLGNIMTSKEKADRSATSDRIACTHIKITYFEGEGL